MKKILALILALMTSISVAYAQSDVKVNINGEDFVTDVEPMIVNDRVLVPMRAIFEKFGAMVEWEPETKTIYAASSKNMVVMQIDNNVMFTATQEVALDVAPIISNDRTLVPLRAVSEGLGAQVDWDSETRTAIINFAEEEKTEITEVIPVTIEMEDGGVMKAELYPEIAPTTVENFVKLADEGFFDGLIFHRVIPEFMIQGGGYDKDMNEKETDSIVGEFTANGFENNLAHTRGVLSMARTMIPDSASSQFFIMHEDAPHLDGYYAAFGMLTDGFDVLDKIANVETGSLDNGMTDVPTEPQIIKTIKVEKNEQ